MLHTPALRIGLYFAVSIFSIVLLGLTAAEINYTLGFGFYHPIVAELLVTSCLTILWSWFIIHTIHSIRVRGPVTTFRDEAIGFLVIWIMYLVGTAISTNFWANLSFCSTLFECRLLSAIVAFAWLNFITMTLLAFSTIIFLARNTPYGGIREPLHGRWGTGAMTGATGTTGTTGNNMTQAGV